ncbi:unnamed protein product, partial [Mesorhabditis belari]|uniref:receptor protein serine/threonine kinase n=1 Tax=Mesorhabditis belari TaxID=2138241 RepID=A0AAF3EBJ1_9BILA
MVGTMRMLRPLFFLLILVSSVYSYAQPSPDMEKVFIDILNHSTSTNESLSVLLDGQNLIDKNLLDQYKKYGDLGKHYSIDDQTLFILCEQYNSTKCTLEGDCTRRIEKCFFEKKKNEHPLRPGCMAAFSYNHTTTIERNNWKLQIPAESMELRGCWPYDHNMVDSCVFEDECLAHYSGPKRQALFCCCKTHLCNDRNMTFVADSLYYYRELAKKTLFARGEPITEESLQKETELRMKEAAENPPKPPGSDGPETTNYTSVHWIIYFSIGVLLFMLLFLLIIFGSYLYRAHVRNKQSKTSSRASHPTTMTVEQQKARMRDDRIRALQVPNIREITNQERVAMGRFAEVFRAEMFLTTRNEPLTVALKKFRIGEIESFMHETEIFSLSTWKTRQHPYLTRFFGVYAQDGPMGQELSIVTEFQRRGSLYDFCKDSVMSLHHCLHILVTLLDGVAFLHEEGSIGKDYKFTIVHRDIKSRNVLLRDDYSAVLTDFGLAMRCDKLIHRGHELRGMLSRTTPIAQVGTSRYMAPEVLEGATEFSAAAFRQMDVYALALVIWEVVSRTEVTPEEPLTPYKMPYEEEVGKNPSLAQMREVVATKKIRPRYRRKITDNPILRQLASTGVEMWDPEADGRITAGCAMERVKEFIKELSGRTTSEEDHHDSGVSLTGSVNSACVGGSKETGSGCSSGLSNTLTLVHEPNEDPHDGIDENVLEDEEIDSDHGEAGGRPHCATPRQSPMLNRDGAINEKHGMCLALSPQFAFRRHLYSLGSQKPVACASDQ